MNVRAVNVRVMGSLQELELRGWTDVRASEPRVRLDHHAAISLLREHLDAGASIDQLRALLVALEGVCDRLDEAAIVRLVALRIVESRICVVRRDALRPTRPSAHPQCRGRSRADDRDERRDEDRSEMQWIEAQLVGEDGEPIAGVRCRISLPCGRVVQGRTDARGVVRVDGISSTRDCWITFPDLDADAWERV